MGVVPYDSSDQVLCYRNTAVLQQQFLGIGARFLLVVNLSKVPLLSNLNLINADSLKVDAMLLPGIFGRIFVGKLLIEKIPPKVFDWLLYAFSIIGGVRLLFW